jgi:hypothetical protein
MDDPTPIVGTVTVLHQGPFGVTALLNDEHRIFPTLEAVFRAAIYLLEQAPGRAPRAVQAPLPILERRLQ